MTRFRTARLCAAVAMALVLGVTLHEVLPRPRPTRVASVGPLTGRHLQVPWWEDVKIYPSAPHQVTYVIPGTVLFDSGSSAISAQGHAFLISLVPKLRGATKVTVAGCTDPIGGVDSPYNVNLGMSRARSAASALEAAGLLRSIFDVVSWADTHPIRNTTGLDSATVNSLDRRIVIIVTRSES
jgi:outer membrane protein OmpA-like peptidoglycan-associated protein